MPGRKFSIIAAVDNKFGIGKRGKLPWYSPTDMKYFKNITKGGIVIMGRRTWESISEKHRPLSNRFNIILSREMNDIGFDKNTIKISRSLNEALEYAYKMI